MMRLIGGRGLDGLEVVLNSGQVGGRMFFEDVRSRPGGPAVWKW